MYKGEISRKISVTVVKNSPLNLTGMAQSKKTKRAAEVKRVNFTINKVMFVRKTDTGKNKT